MQSILEILWPVAGLLAGGAIGFGFGLIQNAALRRHQRREAEGRFNNAWRVMPGSGARVMFLLVALVLIQILCPMLFTVSAKWWVSAGVMAGYGWVLFRQLQERTAHGT